MAIGSWQTKEEVGKWQLAVGSWQLATKEEVGKWQLAVGNQKKKWAIRSSLLANKRRSGQFAIGRWQTKEEVGKWALLSGNSYYLVYCFFSAYLDGYSIM